MTDSERRHSCEPGGLPPDPIRRAGPGRSGFLGKTRDTTTGLTHIGARECDPVIGQFISVDPLLEVDKQQTLNGDGSKGNGRLHEGVFTPCTWLTTVSQDDLIERAGVLSSAKLSEIEDALRLGELG
ncbi:RHS repeat-associated protein [Streptomyces sp. SAI-127]|nr:RHS repeat-associated protein [Streptomyces sp. SAI-127]